MSKPSCTARSGFVLILALWSLMFLTVLAVTVGVGTRQKILLLSRLEDRSAVRLALTAGLKVAHAVLADDLEMNQQVFTPLAKQRRHNNPAEFVGIASADKMVDVFCQGFDDVSGVLGERYGWCDEQSKVNVNTTSQAVLSRLCAAILRLDTESANRLARNIIDWRDYGRHEAEGFFSDDYYKNLEYPYTMKETPFERIDELLLVKGVSLEIYKQLRPFVTIYGDGRINVNTASRHVLMAVGLDETVADKLLSVRRGADKLDYTTDDHIFIRTFDVAAEVKTMAGLELNEVRQLDVLSAQNVFTISSLMYSTTVIISSDGKEDAFILEAVLDARSDRFLFWYEK